MAAALITTKTTMVCPHGGTVIATKLVPGAKVMGGEVLTLADAFQITGCPFMLGNTPHPCVTIQWQPKGTGPRSPEGELLTSETIGICQGPSGAPQGTVSFVPDPIAVSTTPGAG
ncbi:MAG: hypothetical protein AAGF12_16565 [Myxococcota bacterium]